MNPRPVLFISNYFPPEVNALANRTWEHARVWAADGGQIEVLAGPPHFPEGRIYEGHRNRLTYDRIEDVDVLRVPMYVAANEGFVRRTLSYLSFMLSAFVFSSRGRVRPGVIVASSPQLFAGLAGWLVARRGQRPFVLEVRDLWPESIVTVGAMQRGMLVEVLERIETFLYRSADHIVVVSPAFRAHIEARGVPKERISVLPNGVQADWLDAGKGSSSMIEATAHARSAVDELRGELGLADEFIASYIGTTGMAHGLEVLLEAARRCQDPKVMFLVVGAGAEWQKLHDAAEAEGLDNLRVLEKQPRERVKLFYSLSDVSIVHLSDRPAFRKVIPSKMFEAMAMRRPIVLGVRGEARRILDEAKAGIGVTPEDADDLLDAVLRLKGDPSLRERMGAAGADHVREHYDRRTIARRYWVLLQSVAASR